ncbi:MAG: hypothetical protein HYX34_09005 [Actinobacteria bacterium]|nr:hypothetical protein [Actinomycetota bacterium]
MALDELVAVLQRERELLDQLRFRFIETRLLLAAREVRYLGWATAEAEQARRRARETDLVRAAAVQRWGSAGVRTGVPTLRELATAVGGPVAGILRDHHDGLCTTVSEIEVIGHRNAELARAGIRELADQAESVPTMAARASPAAASVALSLPDARELLEDGMDLTALATEGAYQEVITLAGRLRMPALLAFLR